MPNWKRDKKKNYEVGYGKPPKHTQFQPGKSGNRKGRPKKNTTFKGLYQEVMNEKVEITDKRTKKKMKITLLELILRQLANLAAKGDMDAFKQIAKLEKEFGHLELPEEPPQTKIVYFPSPMTIEEWKSHYAKPAPDSAYDTQYENDGKDLN